MCKAGLTPVGHPAVTGTQFPKKIIEPLTRIGDLVVDPMAGIGSILVAAQRLERQVQGIEINPAWADIANKWLTTERET